MRPRKWVLVFFSALAIVSVLSYFGIRFVERNANVERVLAERISPLIGGSFDVERVRLGFFSAYLENVRVGIPLQGFRVEIRDIKIGFSLRRLIRFRGDFGKSIGRIILLEPDVTVTLLTELALEDSVMVADPVEPVLGPLIDEFPVEHLLVRNGSVSITDRKGRPFQFGSRLNGVIGEQGGGLFFELKGKLASRRKNLFLSGKLSRGGERHRLSMRIERARVDRPVDIGAVTIDGGVLDGVCEVSFGDTISGNSVDIGGWINVDKGSCDLGRAGSQIKDITLRTGISHTVISVDTLKGKWNDIEVSGEGVWDVSHRDSLWATVLCEDMELGELSPDLPPLIKENVLGQGWVRCEVRRDQAGAPMALSFFGGGITVMGAPVTVLRGDGRLESGQGWLDSLVMQAGSFSADAEGVLSFSESPVAYSLDVNARCDSIPILSELKGEFGITAAMRGVGKRISGNAEIRGKNAFWDHVPFGSPVISVSAENGQLQFVASPNNSNFVVAAGEVQNFIQPHRVFRAEIKAGSSTIEALLSGLSPSVKQAIGVRQLTSRVFYSQDSIRTDLFVDLEGDAVRGRVDVAVGKDPERSESMRWHVENNNLTLSDSVFSFTAQGGVLGDSLVVENFSIVNRVSGSAKIVGGVHPSMEFDVTAQRVSLAALNRWAGVRLPVDSGYFSGRCRLAGPSQALNGSADLHIRDASIGGIGPMETDMVVWVNDGALSIPPMIFRKEGRTLISMDTLWYGHDTLRCAGKFDDVDLRSLLGDALPDDLELMGRVTGGFRSSPGMGLPIVADISCQQLSLESWSLDSITANVGFGATAMNVFRFRAKDSTYSVVTARGTVPYTFMNERMREGDTVDVNVSINGDLVATTGRNFDSPIAGSGKGEANFHLIGTGEGWAFRRGTVSMPHGVLRLEPFVKDPIKDFSFTLNINDSSQVDLDMKGAVGRKDIRIFTSHDIPAGYEPLVIGPLDIGVIQVETPDRGIHLHVPGFQEIGETGLVEFAGKAPFQTFTLSGPVEELRITGTWILHDVDFTYPFIIEPLPWEFDPFPYIDWELDLKIGRRVVYFWELRGKRRQLIRFCDLHVDRSSWLSVRGRDLDKTFKLEGVLKTFKGGVYFGRTFDRNVRAGVEFAPQHISPTVGYDNFPLIWGKAEAFSDTSRFDRITLTLQVIDPSTGGVSDRGRIALMPASKARLNRDGPKTVLDSLPNFRFHLSSNFEEIPGESEREFYQQAGLLFTSFEGAGAAVSNFGEQYLHRYLFQRFERRLAKRLGLDVVTFESSFASNYFSYLYNREYDQLINRWNLLANVGVTVGRYFFRDYLFLKARGEFVPADTIVRPEYSIGLEFMPAQYFMMDFNYGFYVENSAFQYNPRVQMQLRLPITRLRNTLDF